MGACAFEWTAGPMVGIRSPVWWQVDLLNSHFVRAIDVITESDR